MRSAISRSVQLVRCSAWRLINNTQTHSTLQACYKYGAGVPQNYQEARRLFALASAQGDADAAKALHQVDEVIRNDPRQAITRPTGRKKPKPNVPCSCGSGQKYKKCCGANQ